MSTTDEQKPVVKKIENPVDDPIIALGVSDIHLSLNPPVARSKESDWFAAMLRPIEELKFLQKCLNVPILCSGDIFHHWRSAPEVVNWALDHLPFMYAIPGQHDLPNHDFGQVKRSAYWTLQQAGVIETVTPAGKRIDSTLTVYGFPWNVEICHPHLGGSFSIALVHKYVYLASDSTTHYQGAPEDGRIGFVGELKSESQAKYPFDVTMFGDNHVSFMSTMQGVLDSMGPGGIPRKVGTGKFRTLYNPGSLMRRNSDQVEHRPQIGMVHRSGQVKPYYLDCSKDVLDRTSRKSEIASEAWTEEFKPFLDELRDLHGTSLNYPDALRAVIHKCSPSVRKLLTEALETK